MKKLTALLLTFAMIIGMAPMMVTANDMEVSLIFAPEYSVDFDGGTYTEDAAEADETSYTGGESTDEDDEDMQSPEVEEQTAPSGDLRSIETQMASPVVVITAFADLPAGVASQTVAFGTALEVLDLPADLMAVADADSTVVVPVSWSSAPEFEGFAGEYIFTAAVQGDFVVAEGVELPVITVVVEPIGVVPLTIIDLATQSPGSGPSWSLVGDNIFMITGSDPIHITGGAESSPITNRSIGIGAGVTANLTIEDLHIMSGVVSGAIVVGGNLVNNSTLNLTIVGTNTLQSGGTFAGLDVITGSAVVIEGTGILTATGSLNSAGIGGGNISPFHNAGTITINSGTINAIGNGGGAGIGGGNSGSGGNITINGGTVNATGGNNAAGIGGGNGGAAGSITITGGTFPVMNSAQLTSALTAIGNGTGTIRLGTSFTHTTSITIDGNITLDLNSETLTVNVDGNINSINITTSN
ncbi:MAG: hypothetical protein FWD03_08180, partial [Defluviitaleaceae bacterium]|nr:hypothetical protein [Defluviitaleaceae bacterium]